MVEVEVLVDNFKDNDNYNKKITIVRNNQTIEIRNKLLLKGDIYSVTKERYESLSKKGIVAKVKKAKQETSENVDKED